VVADTTRRRSTAISTSFPSSAGDCERLDVHEFLLSPSTAGLANAYSEDVDSVMDKHSIGRLLSKQQQMGYRDGIGLKWPSGMWPGSARCH
jgi:hypothetical protein